MARALWSGAISFGLVNVPVKLFKATPTDSAHGISFHRLHKCGTRLKHERVCPACNLHDVPWDEVVSGYEYARGRHAIVDREELAAVDRGEIGAIAIQDFVEADEVPPMVFDKSYWIAPDGPPKPYALLYQALLHTGRVAVARVVVRTRSHLAVVRAQGGHLVLSTMFFAEEMVGEEAVPPGAEGVTVSDRELDLARELVDRMTVTFDHHRYPDEVTVRMRELLVAKIAEKGDRAEGPAAAHVGEGEVIDIMDALRRSLQKTSAERAEETALAHHGNRDRADRKRRAPHARSGRALRKGSRG